jgi:hypothetical protein
LSETSEFNPEKYKIKVRVIPVDMTEEVHTLQVTDGLRQYQSLVDGYIEIVQLPHMKMDGRTRTRLVMVVNEEGLLQSLPFNPRASQLARRPIVGNAFIVGERGDHFVDFRPPLGITR